MRMHAANNNDIRILDVAILRFMGSGEIPLETHQMVYVTDNSDKLYLSREACTEFGLISKSFPKLGETFGLGWYPATEDQQISSSICNLPKSEPPPPLPTALPFPPDEKHRQNLHSYLLNHYVKHIQHLRASTLTNDASAPHATDGRFQCLAICMPHPDSCTTTLAGRDRYDEIVADIPNKTKCIDDTPL